MAKNITDFKTALKRGGARPNLFRVELNFPQLSGDISAVASNNTLKTQASFLVKAAQLPASSIGVIEVPFKGRMLKVAGDRTFEPWTVTVINDGEFSLRQAFETWSRQINALTENVSALGYGAASSTNGVNTTGNSGTNASVGLSYCQDMFVYQLDRDNIQANRGPDTGNAVAAGEDNERVVRAYRFYDAWPAAISAIDLGYESNNQVEEFTVEFQYQYYEVSQGSNNQLSSGNGG